MATRPLEWCPVYYHKADAQGIGFDRSSKGTDAVGQYPEPVSYTHLAITSTPVLPSKATTFSTKQLVGTIEQTDRIAGGDSCFVLNVVALLGRTRCV